MTGPVHGVLLAAGAGRRMGRPKALVDDWLERSLAALHDGGCARVVVVLGARAAEAEQLLRAGTAFRPPGDEVVVADDWEQGMGASLRAGLAVVPAGADALVHLVDLPDVTADVVRRVLAARTGPAALARAAYGTPGAPVAGHPVLLGADHVAAVAASAQGDRGARDYLRERDVALVECGDLAGGEDVDSR